MFIVYAHRGASEYAPENTMSSFYLGLQQGANGIETDIRRTKDGVLVLFHDRTLERVVGIEGTIGDYTYAELMKLRVKNAHTETEDVIIAFEDFLRYFGFRDLHFAIELKDADVESLNGHHNPCPALRGSLDSALTNHYRFGYVREGGNVRGTTLSKAELYGANLTAYAIFNYALKHLTGTCKILMTENVNRT